MIQYLFALTTTILIEFAVYYAFIRKSPWKLLIYSILINSFTQPIATFIYQNALSNLILVEVMVFLAEIPLIKWLLEIKYPKSILLSFAANLLTSLIGFILFF